MSGEVAGEDAGNSDGAVPGVEDLVGTGEGDGHRGEVGGQGRGGQASAGRVDEEVEQLSRALGRAGEQEAAAPQAGETRFGDRGGEPGPEGGVDRVPPGPQHGGGRRDGLPVTRGNRRLPTHGRSVATGRRRYRSSPVRPTVG